MISCGDLFSIPLPVNGLVQEHEQNPNPRPTSNSSAKRKRNLPGTPDPDAEVVALSPRTLMATNRFVCDVCNKGFQRDQNLQLHRRGHNLPWKLKQRTSKDPVKKVYLCPEKSCVHHDPTRALGDLTGVKKHYSRKHGEKKWKCEKCSKKYAVRSDWKAHSKTCGTREYKCDCGTIFSRKDSFTTHRAFCDALIEESSRFTSSSASRNTQLNDQSKLTAIPQIGMDFHFQQDYLGNSLIMKPRLPLLFDQANPQDLNSAGLSPNPDLFAPSSSTGEPNTIQMLNTDVFSSSFAGNYGNPWSSLPHRAIKEESFSSNGSQALSLLLPDRQSHRSESPASMSATTLLQKAAWMGSSNATFFGNTLGVTSSSNFLVRSNLDGSTNMRSSFDIDRRIEEMRDQEIPINMLRESNGANGDLTRDFLGVGEDENGNQFLPRELAKFSDSMSSYFNGN